MKKTTIKLCFMIATVVVMLLSLVGCAKPLSIEQGDFNTVIGRVLPDLKVGEDGKFDVLVLTDTHFMGYSKNDTKTLEAIKNAISDDTYELVVITGDMLEGNNKSSKYNKAKAILDVATLFEENKQYWAFVSGNNDGEYCGNRQAIFSSLVKYEYCLVSDSNVGGVGNYTINIKNSQDEKLHTMIFMDSGMRGEDGELVAMTAAQIEWYKAIAQENKTDGLETSLYMHIPFIEFIDAYDKGEVIATYSNHLSTKDINTHKDNSLLYKAMFEIGNNKLIATGHTHGEDYARKYQDMLWLQVRASGYGVWNDGLPNGGAKITYDFQKGELIEKYSITSINFAK